MPKIRVRARALDMLGRQQMASVPNALHELFKNAHDAYADHVEVDYYRRSGTLVLWDDGVGMTQEDFESRWLTLGTESKVEDGGMDPPYRDPKKTERVLLGAKGIGRLAIATVGPQAFVFTRAERDDGLKEFVTAFINWTFFEVPGLDLDDIDFPIFASKNPKKDCVRIVADSIQHCRKQVRVLGDKLRDPYRSRILSDLVSLEKNSPRMLEILQHLPVLEGRGTAFLVHPVDTILERDIDDTYDDLPSILTKILRGFSNTMMPRETPVPLAAAFRDHGRDGSVVDLIGSGEFFTPAEFLQADHHFEGAFDEYGQFSGTIQLFRGEPKPYAVPWDGARGVPTSCGPFRIKVAYLQGLEKESLLPKEEYLRMKDKLDRFGGLYVYRDGIRILPYGNSDYDFLNIERRRTKSASDWYLSYRRIFGAVELTHSDNGVLVEKAGREGFREDRAYRQFRDMLDNFFKMLAMDWFREETVKYGNFHELKANIKRQNELLARREKGAKAKRDRFTKALDVFYAGVEQAVPQHEIEDAQAELSDRLQHIAPLGPEDAARELLQLEADMRARLDSLRGRYRIVKPRGFGLTKKLQRDWERSVAVSQRLEKELFDPLAREVDQRVTTAIIETRALVDRRRRLMEQIRSHEQRDVGRARALIKETKISTNNLEKEIVTRTRSELSAVDAAFKTAIAELEREDLAHLDDREVAGFQDSAITRLQRMVDERMGELERLGEQVQSVLESIREGTPLDETAAVMEERNKVLEEQVEHFGELAQIGAALGIIQHEFGSTVNGVRDGIQGLRRFVGNMPELQETYKTLRSTFEHLDTYLSMFTPLDRRLYRKAIPLSGKEIRGYLLQFFDERFKRHGVDLKATSTFLGHTVVGYPSTFLPPFINILDNALFWLARDSAGTMVPCENERRITLDADCRGFLISNSGPGVEERDAERIFEFSFSRKLRGRGMGLAISRKALRDSGFDLTLEQVGRDEQPVFRIWTVQVESMNDSEKEDADV